MDWNARSARLGCKVSGSIVIDTLNKLGVLLDT